MQKCDVLIIGSGVAALQLAGHLSKDLNVIVLTKSHLKHGNSSIAQGGVAAALGAHDHPHLHYTDTLEAGRHINNSLAVQDLTEAAPSVMRELIETGCEFDFGEDGSPLLGMEGSHQQHRIIHGGGDQTGKRLVDGLIKNVGSNVEVIENLFVYELLTHNHEACYGAKGKDANGDIHTFFADHVVLSTGGCGQVYEITSNASTVTGDGLALAYRAGAEMIDMEFVQFHPTLLYVNGEAKGLVSEAVRGEGAQLVTSNGKRIMEGVHPLEDLAPRHVVSQTIFDYIQQGIDIFLDIHSISNFHKRFPTITKLCEQNGVPISERKIPVAPGCHFLMGGIKTDQVGRTNIKGLYAIGEVACTGVHGANRLASNSLLEGLVYGKRLAQSINHAKQEKRYTAPFLYKRKSSTLPHLPTMDDIQSSMMKHTGIVRTKEGLIQQREMLESYKIKELLEMDYDRLSINDITTVFMLITSWMITSSALERTESRGGHFRSDIPIERDEWISNHITLQRQWEKGEVYELIKDAATT
ncbi:L-aspartate oxidase [Pontibacillus sp. HMF3514]|uniref:L-aspartate oxidase n=1 Tax=Pontibacillus sp. HMF3514 TaxID=2692425 RepID=UPI0013201115|nr:L-aspartate oxidase [Pontibacillus sp. HMF3514]QHE53989.1 L-aspartate oxidase [Pontibacillus sp. HMF3514]